jgi:hypothetical protein
MRSLETAEMGDSSRCRQVGELCAQLVSPGESLPRTGCSSCRDTCTPTEKSRSCPLQMANHLLSSSQRIVPEVQIAVDGCIHFAVRLPGMILHLHCTTVFFHTFRHHQTQGAFIDYFVQTPSSPVQQSALVSGTCVGGEAPTNSTIAHRQPCVFLESS